METIDQLYQRKEHVTGVATGFHSFDTMTAGMQPSDLIIIAPKTRSSGRVFYREGLGSVLSSCERKSQQADTK